MNATIKEGIVPMAGQLGITAACVAVFYLFIAGMHTPNLVEPHLFEGEMTDPTVSRFIFLCIAFIGAFIFAALAQRKSDQGKTFTAFWYGVTGGTMLWQSIGECSWHFDFRYADVHLHFPRLEGMSASFFVLMAIMLVIYGYRHRKSLSFGIWIFILCFLQNWIGHYLMIGTYPFMTNGNMEEAEWFRLSGGVIGAVTIAAGLWLLFKKADSTRTRLACSVLLFMGLGIIVTGCLGV